MSALVFHRIPKGSAFSNTCDEVGCAAKGCVRIQIAGRSVLSHKSFGFPDQAQLCDKHAKQWRKTWKECNGEQVEAETRRALRVLVAVAADESGPAQVKRTDAIDALLTIGFTSEQVLHFRAQAIDGLTAAQILERLNAGAPELLEVS